MYECMSRLRGLLCFASPLVPQGTREPEMTSTGALVFSSQEDAEAYKNVMRVKCPRGVQIVSGKNRLKELGTLRAESGRQEWLPPAASYAI